MMRHRFVSWTFALSLLGAAVAAESPVVRPGSSLFVFAGDAAKVGNDFLAVIDVDPASPGYGRLISAVGTDLRSVQPHHTEYVMPESGKLFANDHDAGRTFIFDVRDPAKPSIVTSFDDMAGFSHPHSFVRLPNGNVLATFQHRAHPAHGDGQAQGGGLVEIDDQGRAVRSAGNLDPSKPGALMMPYGLVILPEIDRVLSTNSTMHDDDLLSGTTYQVWRLSDLTLLTTAFLDPGENRYAHISPEEPRRGPDGAVYIQTLGCGIERVTGIETPTPTAKLVYTFPGNWCGVPTIAGNYLVQSVPVLHGFVVLDLSRGEKPVEVSRLVPSATFEPHWSAWDPATRRLVATPGGPGDNRLYLMKLDLATGALTLDESFRDAAGDGKVGFSFSDRPWPHGFQGAGNPHGAVFSR
ncbi:MAG: hypothetical protein ABI689_18825 [Thermoanaerobaculia bacterium]